MLYIWIQKTQYCVLNMLIVSRLIYKLNQYPNRFVKLGKTDSITDMEEQEDKKIQDSSKEGKNGNIASL